MQTDTAADLGKAVWQAVEQLSDVPLLPQWQSYLTSALVERENIRCYIGNEGDSSLFNLQAAYVCIPEDFDVLVSEGLRSGRLNI